MRSSTLSPPAPLNEKQRMALVSLLADEDPSIHQMVRERILAYGQAAVPWLRPHTLSGDGLMRRRSQEIIQTLARESADEVFLAFCLNHGEDLDLEEGVWRLAQT